jgi:hypothetical protein
MGVLNTSLPSIH